MRSKRKVLLVVEGAKKEVELFEKLFSVYKLDFVYEIYSYCTNMYELYERMFLTGDDPADLSFLGVLKERALEEHKPLFDQDYSDVILVFDYDMQDNRFSMERLVEMQEYFNESTNEGKLYINYPMVEACKHFKVMPDYGFLSRKVRFSEVRSYKKTVGDESKYQSFKSDFTQSDFDTAIALTAAKACIIVDRSADPLSTAAHYVELDHRKILFAQNDLLRSAGEISVLGTCLLFVADYSQDLANLDMKIRHLFKVANWQQDA